MKKFTFYLLTGITLFTILNIGSDACAQTILYEDFQDGIPVTWGLIDNDGNTPAPPVSYVDNAWVTRSDFADPDDTVAVSTSWYDPAGTSDDWLITPAIVLDSNDILSWMAYAPDPDFADGYEVRISTTTPNIAGFMANPALFSIAEESSDWVLRQVDLDLAGYQNQTVYIAFRNNSNDKFLLLLDDVKVSTPSPFDLAVTGVGGLEYTVIPESQDYVAEMKAGIENVGGNTVTNVKVAATLFKNNMQVYTDTVTYGSLASGAVDTVIFNSFIPANFGTGSYELVLSASTSDADTIPDNDILIIDTLFTISDSVYARDNSITSNSLGFNNGTGSFGQTFTVYNTDTLSSVTFTLDDPTPGDEMTVTLYTFDGTNPVDDLETTGTFTIPGAGTYTLVFPNGIILSPDVYFISADQLSNNNLTLAVSDNLYTPGTTYFNAAAAPGWTPLEDVGFQYAFQMRPNFGEAVTVGVNTVSLENQVSVFPNPSSGKVFVKIQAEASSDYEVTIRDVIGKEISKLNISDIRNGRFELDMAGHPDGIYMISVRSDEQVITRRISLKN